MRFRREREKKKIALATEEGEGTVTEPKCLLFTLGFTGWKARNRKVLRMDMN